MDSKSALLLFAFSLLALLPSLSFSAAASCSSYGELCASGCCAGLECDSSGKCNQKFGVCDIAPQKWVFTPLSSTEATPGSVKGVIEQTQEGKGLVAGSCTGTPAACFTYSASQSECAAHGCSWNILGGQRCTGAPKACAAYSSTALCQAVSGCSWSTTGIYQVGWFNNWQTAGIIGVLIAIFIIAIAAIIGHSFNMPGVKAFVDSELMQAVVSVLLIVSMMGLIIFFDTIARLAILEGGVQSTCPDSGEPCYITVARSYLTTYYDLGSKSAEEALVRSVDYQKYANRGLSIQANLWWLGFAGVSFRPSAGLSIEAERAGAVFETISKLLASIYAQKYFIDVVSYGIAPILLLLGILLRTFFFTRKLGGLLLAIALSLFIIYPLTYALAYYTLKIEIYGDRLTAEESTCPAECKLQPPAAFYAESNAAGEAHLVYFQHESDLVNAKVTKSNWDSGDVDGDGAAEFPGLVACKELPNLPAGENPSASAPSNSCKDAASGEVCPAYCREVPTPDIYPECSSAACSACNPGCKIMRQRLDCKPGVCPSDATKQCSRSCKTELPVENKCYLDEYTNNNVQADLSVSCGRCSACPNWCLLRKPDPNNPGQNLLVYGNEPACNVPACKPDYLGGTCPDKCAYVTQIGSDTNCNTQCSGCPLPCRVTAQFGLAPYDTEQLLSYCSNFPSCSSCPSVCKTEIPPDPLDEAQQPPSCAPYPQNPQPGLQCTSCPEYCRFTDYGFITDESNTARESTTNLPEVCSGSQVKCQTSDCNLAGGCRASGTPITCRPYDTSYPTDIANCKSCPMECRKTPLPPGCDPFACNDILQGGNCPNVCKVPAGNNNPPICSEYIGYGKPDDFITHCWSENDPQGACWELPLKCVQNGCNAGVPERCWGPAACTSDKTVKFVKTACEAKRDQGCMWKEAGNPEIPIQYRDEDSRLWPAAYYQERTECRQCPENCRIGDSENDCGISDNGGDNKLKVDCSADACPVQCRVQVPLAPSGPTYCKAAIPPETPGFGCPALCRRYAGESNPQTIAGQNFCRSAGCQDYNPQTHVGITDLCRFPDAPETACSECFDCPIDCVYTPAVRTDCAEVCGDATAGAPDIDSASLYKSLPGGSGRTDVRNAGIFMLPALVLPLFNIVIIIAFIRVFSPTLGGDIEIPGLSRIL